MKAPIVLAVDTNDLQIAQRWIEATHESVSVFKLGLEFFLTFGHDGVRAIKSVTDADIFLDLKLHDIPHTVSGAAQAVHELAPKFLTVHASGGRAMISAAVAALLANKGILIPTKLFSSEFKEDIMNYFRERKEDE